MLGMNAVCTEHGPGAVSKSRIKGGLASMDPLLALDKAPDDGDLTEFDGFSEDMQDDSIAARDAFIAPPMAIYHQGQVHQAPAPSVQLLLQHHALQAFASTLSGSMATPTPAVASNGGGGPRTRVVGLDMLAKAAHREGLPVYGTAMSWAGDGMGGGATTTASSTATHLAQEIMVHAYVALVNLGLADVRKTTNFLRTCHAYAKVLGVDPTNGLQETASWATRSGKLVDAPMPQAVGYPKWMTVPLHDEDCCRAWSASIGNTDLVMYGNAGFSRLFFSGEEMRSIIRDSRLMCFYLWSRIIAPDELARFYQAFVEVTFKHSLFRVFLMVKCLTKHGEEKRCLVELTYHSSHVADGRPLSAYQLQIWLLGHRPLPLTAPATRPVVQIS